MENNKKIDLASLIMTCAIITICLIMAVIFYTITKVDYSLSSTSKPDGITINKDLYNKIINNTQKSEEIKASSDDFGRTNPFEKK